MKPISQKMLKKMLRYDPETGIFIWRVSPSQRVKKGSQAGHVYERPNGTDVLRIGLKGKMYYLHRLAYLYMEGELPTKQVKHISIDVKEGEVLNNAWDNLYLYTPEYKRPKARAKAKAKKHVRKIRRSYKHIRKV